MPLHLDIIKLNRFRFISGSGGSCCFDSREAWTCRPPPPHPTPELFQLRQRERRNFPRCFEWASLSCQLQQVGWSCQRGHSPIPVELIEKTNLLLVTLEKIGLGVGDVWRPFLTTLKNKRYQAKSSVHTSTSR